jgi:DNA-binding beta-propeller fold protein YncE
MKYALTFALALAFASQGVCQEKEGSLRLVRTIDMPGVEGRFDHFAVDLKGQRLFLASIDHKAVEVFDLREGKWIHSIGGFSSPHAEFYVPASNQILVIDGGDGTPNGWCKILRGDTFEVIKSVKLALDADPIRYDPVAKYLYVGNGGEHLGNNYSLVSVIDTTNGNNLADIRVESPALEAMAVEHSGTRLFVNMKSYSKVGIIDREKRQVVSTWSVPAAVAADNRPMALDEADHRLFVVTHTPPKLIVFDTDSGKVVASVPCVGAADDMAYDAVHKRVYITGEEGFISVIGRSKADEYRPIAQIPTAPGARNSLFVPELNQLFVAVPGKGQQKAKVLVFQVEP